MANIDTNAVALIGPTGSLGSELFRVLSSLHSKGALKLVVLHRATTKLPSLPQGVEARILDINTATEADVHAALRGVDVVINASSHTDLSADLRFLEYLASLPTPLKAYIPSDYSLPYTPADLAVADIELIKNKTEVNERARSLGIPLTTIHNGVFEPFLFYKDFSGVDVNNAKLVLYGDAANQPLPLTSMPYLAAAIGHVVQKAPESLENNFVVIEYTATGKEIAAAVEAASGKTVAMEQWTEEDVERARKSGGPGVLVALIRVKWGKGEFPTRGTIDPDVPRRGIADAAQDAVNAAKAS